MEIRSRCGDCEHSRVVLFYIPNQPGVVGEPNKTITFSCQKVGGALMTLPVAECEMFEKGKPFEERGVIQAAKDDGEQPQKNIIHLTKN